MTSKNILNKIFSIFNLKIFAVEKKQNVAYQLKILYRINIIREIQSNFTKATYFEKKRHRRL